MKGRFVQGKHRVQDPRGFVAVEDLTDIEVIVDSVRYKIKNLKEFELNEYLGDEVDIEFEKISPFSIVLKNVGSEDDFTFEV